MDALASFAGLSAQCLLAAREIAGTGRCDSAPAPRRWTPIRLELPADGRGSKFAAARMTPSGALRFERGGQCHAAGGQRLPHDWRLD